MFFIEQDLRPPAPGVFFANLPRGLEEIALRRLLYELCCQAGPVVAVRLLLPKGYGFVTFEHVESAIYAVALFRGNLMLYGQPVAVNFSDRGSVPSLTDAQLLLWRKCQAVLADPALAHPKRTQANQHAPYVLQSLQ